ncbi:MAG: hypothetical protein IPI67_15685 [Myxococcales bacterium]|nr:hypothetical protein [Myxococcales bacterium]
MGRRRWLWIAAALFSCGGGEAPPDPGRVEQTLAAVPERDHHPEGVLGHPVSLPDGRRIESRTGRDPGESDLWLIEASGASAPLTPAPGFDELPFVLPDGRVTFVSGRTTVASLFVVEPNTGETQQLTNIGLAAGKPWSGFVPPPAREPSFSDGALHYDDGSGKRWRVDVATGAATEDDAP